MSSRTQCESYSLTTRKRCRHTAVARNAKGLACGVHFHKFHEAPPPSPPARQCTECLRSEPEVHFAPWQHRCDPCRSRANMKRRCGMCRKTDHDTIDCPLRATQRAKHEASSKVCFTCGSLPHRVPGIRCGECGLRRGPEPKLDINDYSDARSGVDARGL